jgi:uncharacterized protein (TIGR02449 family)
MKGNILERFERQINTLLQNYERLKQDNVALREKQAVLSIERDEWHQKHQMIIDGIEKMIARLQELDHGDISTT